MNAFTALVCSLLVAVSCNAYPTDNEDQWFPYGIDDPQLVDLEDRKFDPENDLEYWLYTRKNPIVRQRIYKGDLDSLAASNFDASKPVKFTLHGLGDKANSVLTTSLAAAFLNISDVNIIAIDWHKAVNGLYPSACLNAVKAGPSMGGFFDWLAAQGAPLENMHILGFSLGGQMAGIASRAATSGSIGYITGLDPAGPFWGADSQRLRPSDASYVEVIHTNAGVLGSMQPLGHNDFYVSGGSAMPGCNGIDFKCSHFRSLWYMLESINTDGFVGTFCDHLTDAYNRNCSGVQTLSMGGTQTKPVYGVFGLEANPRSPYHQG